MCTLVQALGLCTDMTTALKGVKSQRHAPAALYPRESPGYPFYRRLGGPQGRSGQVRKISPPP